MLLPLALVGLAGLVVAAMKLSGPSAKNIAAGLRMPVSTIESAVKWSTRRGVPLEWTLTTILVESSGNPHAAGDAGGRSVGLMQVNSVAHAAELRAAGVTREKLFDPDTNIEWGTKYLSEFRAQVLNALGSRQAPAPLDEIVRLAYKGPATVTNALRRGENPLSLSWAPDALANWRRRMAEVRSAEARGAAASRVS